MKTTAISIKIFLFFAVLLWCTGFFVIQLYPSGPFSIVFPWIKYSYSIVCHQDEAKCFIINNIHLFVCARCTGIYTGALLAAFAALFFKKLPSINFTSALLSLLPMMADWTLYNSGAYNYSKLAAFITGLFPGSVLFIYILSSFEKFFEERNTLNE